MNKNLIKNKFKWLWFFLSLSLLINQPIAAANDSAQTNGGIDTRSFIKGEVFPGTTHHTTRVTQPGSHTTRVRSITENIFTQLESGL